MALQSCRGLAIGVYDEGHATVEPSQRQRDRVRASQNSLLLSFGWPLPFLRTNTSMALVAAQRVNLRCQLGLGR